MSPLFALLAVAIVGIAGVARAENGPTRTVIALVTVTGMLAIIALELLP